jgi:hypothetical protein
MHVSRIVLNVDGWYAHDPDSRAARMISPAIRARDTEALPDDAPSDADRLPALAAHHGVVGHAQAAGRARLNGRPRINRRDFATLDDGGPAPTSSPYNAASRTSTPPAPSRTPPTPATTTQRSAPAIATASTPSSTLRPARHSRSPAVPAAPTPAYASPDAHRRPVRPPPVGGRGARGARQGAATGESTTRPCWPSSAASPTNSLAQPARACALQAERHTRAPRAITRGLLVSATSERLRSARSDACHCQSGSGWGGDVRHCQSGSGWGGDVRPARLVLGLAAG